MSGRAQVSRRMRRRVEVRFGPEQPRYIGYSRNVSKSGIMVGAMRVFAPGTFLNLELKFTYGTFRLLGQVIWAREGPIQWLTMGRVGMGIAFVGPPRDFLEIFRGAPDAA